MKRIYPFIFSLVFWGILLVPNFKPDTSVYTFGKDFFGHAQLIEYFNAFRLRLGDRIFPNVVVGKDGWLFYSGSSAIDDYQGTNGYPINELRTVKNDLDSLNDRLKRKGILFVVVIAPDKSAIYPQYMPDQIVKVDTHTRLDQFYAYMHTYGKTPVIDLRPDLLTASQTEPVFFKTDTHWNPYGQYVAYVKILSVLSKQYPVLVPHRLSDFDIVHGGLQPFDMVRLLGFPNILENNLILKPRFESGTKTLSVLLSDDNLIQYYSNQDQNLPSVLIYHDSFMYGVLPFLAPHFRQITAIPMQITARPFTDIIGIWNVNWVDQVHPDIVIFEVVQRVLNTERWQEMP